MRAWISMAILVMGCSGKKPSEIAVRQVNEGVHVLRIENAKGGVTYVRANAMWTCEKGDRKKGDSGCTPVQKNMPVRVGTPVCPCDDPKCAEWCHPIPKDPLELQRQLPDFVIDPRPDLPKPLPPPSDAGTSDAAN